MVYKIQHYACTIEGVYYVKWVNWPMCVNTQAFIKKADRVLCQWISGIDHKKKHLRHGKELCVLNLIHHKITLSREFLGFEVKRYFVILPCTRAPPLSLFAFNKERGGFYVNKNDGSNEHDILQNQFTSFLSFAISNARIDYIRAKINDCSVSRSQSSLKFFLQRKLSKLKILWKTSLFHKPFAGS